MKLCIGAAYHEADRTATSILELLPSVKDLIYKPSKVNNRQNELINNTLPDTSPLYETLTRKCLHQLMYVQAAVPFPDGATSFSASLTKLILDAAHITSLRTFPAIPTEKLVVVRISRIFGMAPFWLFRHANCVVDLSSSEELPLDFIPTNMERVPFPGAVCSISFGSLKMLKACGSAGVFSWLYPALESNPISELHISEDPGHFVAGGMDIISTATSLTIAHPTGTPHLPRYSVSQPAHLFEQSSTLQEASVGGINWSLPERINWKQLRKLIMMASIADKLGLAKPIFQLPLLEILRFHCYSMDRRDAGQTLFPDQAPVIDRIYAELKLDDVESISNTLLELQLQVQQNFGRGAVCDLIHVLPAAKYLCVNAAFTDDVEAYLNNIWQSQRNIKVQGLD